MLSVATSQAFDRVFGYNIRVRHWRRSRATLGVRRETCRKTLLKDLDILKPKRQCSNGKNARLPLCTLKRVWRNNRWQRRDCDESGVHRLSDTATTRPNIWWNRIPTAKLLTQRKHFQFWMLDLKIKTYLHIDDWDGVKFDGLATTARMCNPVQKYVFTFNRFEAVQKQWNFKTMILKKSSLAPTIAECLWTWKQMPKLNLLLSSGKIIGKIKKWPWN